MVAIAEKVAKLERDLVEFKASQSLGTGCSILPFKYKINTTCSLVARHLVSFVFRGKQANPVVMSKINVLIDGQVPGIDGDGQHRDFLASVDYEPSELVANYYYGKHQPLAFTEYVAGFTYDLRTNHGLGTHTVTIDGYIWASCEGSIEIVFGLSG